mgnify:CR=1 FL=1
MKKAKIREPIPIKAFTDELLDYSKNEATEEELDYIEKEVKEMIEMLENAKKKVPVT